MLKNYIKIAIRNLRKNPGYSFINIGGLTIGLTCCLLIFQYVSFEYSFDDFNENAPDLYRIEKTRVQQGGAANTTANTGYAIGPTLAQEVPEVVQFTRLHPEYNEVVVSNPDQPENVFEEEGVYYADPAFFEMFTYPLIEGQPGEVLSEPGTVLLSESAVQKYFGDEDPIGKLLDVRGRIGGEFRVTGVFEDVPANSHLQFDILLPIRDVLQTDQYLNDNGWNWSNFNTYVQLNENADVIKIEQMFTDVVMRSPEGESIRASNAKQRVNAQPLRDIHLGSIYAHSTISGSPRVVRFFTFIGILILLIALVNYTNLATTRALDRAREIGVRKAIGAQKVQLIKQFLFESGITVLASAIFAVFFADLISPVVNNIADVNLANMMWTRPVFWGGLIGTLCIMTLLAGLYPAFILSGFKPVHVLKGKSGQTSSDGLWLRRGLVVFQFAAAIILLVGTTVVHNQVRFMHNMDLGINLEQILTLSRPRILPEGVDQTSATEVFLNEVRQVPSVVQTATSSTLPGQGFSQYMSRVRRTEADVTTAVPGVATRIDDNFTDLYGIEFVAGEGFNSISAASLDGDQTFLIASESAVRAVGFESPGDALNQTVTVQNGGRIVGVFRDFNWRSAHGAQPNMFFYLDRGERRISLKVSTENLAQTIASVEEIYKRLFPGNPFSYGFADEQFDQQYRSDQRFARLFAVFAGLAIFIACLGLFGLASFTAEQRTKEIGIRKVLGATVTNIVGLLSKDFLILVLLGFVIAAPIAWYAMNRWLADFANRIEIGPGIFLIAGGVAVFIALATVSWQSVKAALMNPVNSLRSE